VCGHLASGRHSRAGRQAFGVKGTAGDSFRAIVDSTDSFGVKGTSDDSFGAIVDSATALESREYPATGVPT